MIATITVPDSTEYPALLQVWETSVTATHHFLQPEDIVFFREMIRDQYLYQVQLHVAKDAAGRITGFSGTSGDNLEMLFIHPSARGQGIGKQLLHHAIEALGISRVDVNEQNEQAIGFYIHSGFKVISRSPLDGTGKPYPILHMELLK